MAKIEISKWEHVEVSIGNDPKPYILLATVAYANGESVALTAEQARKVIRELADAIGELRGES